MIVQQYYETRLAEPADLLYKTFTVVSQGMPDFYREDTYSKNKLPVRKQYINPDTILFYSPDGDCFVLSHLQDCCECVTVSDICGDLTDLQDHPIIRAEARSQKDDANFESGTWTFFEFATVKGSVTIRFLGESNGYYSESADVFRIINPNPQLVLRDESDDAAQSWLENKGAVGK